MFTAQQRAAAVSPETALLIEDYPYGFRLRCQMKVWVEFRKGKGFRYVTQTSNPKRPGTWNKPKAGTYSRVSMVIAVDDSGHLHPVSLTEYSSLPEYIDFGMRHAEAMSPHAFGSFSYFMEVKDAYENKRAELGVDNIYNATPEQQTACKLAYMTVVAANVKAGTDY